MHIKRTVMAILILSAFVLVSCQRPASTAPTDLQGDGQVQPTDSQQGQEGDGSQPEPTDDGAVIPDEMATAVAGGFATQTAVAAGGEGQSGGNIEATDEPAPEATAAPEEATQPPAENPTATPVPPADTPVPPKVTSCDSPYTVQAGDWVWDIGRRCNIHPDLIIAVNGLRWPYTIFPGDVLTLPNNAPAFPGP